MQMGKNYRRFCNYCNSGFLMGKRKVSKEVDSTKRTKLSIGIILFTLYKYDMWEGQYHEFFAGLIAFAQKRYGIDVSETFSERPIESFLTFWGNFPLEFFKDKVSHCIAFPFNTKQLEPFDVEDWQLIELFLKLGGDENIENKASSDVEKVNVWSTNAVHKQWSWTQ